MNNVIRAAAASAALLAAAWLPAAGSAATENGATQHFSFQTQLTDRFHAGGYDGSLALDVHPDGTVQGIYRPSDGLPQPVAGGVTGGQIWFDVTINDRRVHLIGTLRDGVLRATAQIPGPDVWEFDSVSGGPTGR